MSLINQELINAIQNYIPKKNDQLHLLMDLLNMGKETAYRRLRGEVPFSFSEACRIASKLGFSLDELSENETRSKPFFEMELSPLNLIEYNRYKLEQHEESLKWFSSIPGLMLHTAHNMIPYSFLFPYENLFKMYAFRLSYLIKYQSQSVNFGDYFLPPDLNAKRKDLAKKYQNSAENVFIFDRSMFKSYMNEINHFYLVGLITDEEKEILRGEFKELLLDFEFSCAQGKSRTGIRNWNYLSNIDFFSNYSYAKGEGFERAYMDGIYLMDTLSTSDPRICKMHKDWIDSLKKYSTLISISGEKERRAFFNRQHELLAGL